MPYYSARIGMARRPAITDNARMTRTRGKPRPSAAGKDSVDSEAVMSVSPGSSAARRSAAGGSEVAGRVHAVVFTVHLHQHSARVGAHVGEDGAQDVDSLSVEYMAAIFCYEDHTVQKSIFEQ